MMMRTRCSTHDGTIVLYSIRTSHSIRWRKSKLSPYGPDISTQNYENHQRDSHHEMTMMNSDISCHIFISLRERNQQQFSHNGRTDLTSGICNIIHHTVIIMASHRSYSPIPFSAFCRKQQQHHHHDNAAMAMSDGYHRIMLL